MAKIKILDRHMTQEELDWMRSGFNQHTTEQGVMVQDANRFSCTAVVNEKIIGCSSGLAYTHGGTYSGWFYLTDLFVEKVYRSQGLGRILLEQLEKKVAKKGVLRIYTWTAGYEAPTFYQHLGYDIFTELEQWYSDGSSRVGLRKEIKPHN